MKVAGRCCCEYAWRNASCCIGSIWSPGPCGRGKQTGVASRRRPATPSSTSSASSPRAVKGAAARLARRLTARPGQKNAGVCECVGRVCVCVCLARIVRTTTTPRGRPVALTQHYESGRRGAVVAARSGREGPVQCGGELRCLWLLLAHAGHSTCRLMPATPRHAAKGRPHRGAPDCPGVRGQRRGSKDAPLRAARPADDSLWRFSDGWTDRRTDGTRGAGMRRGVAAPWDPWALCACEPLGGVAPFWTDFRRAVQKGQVVAVQPAAAALRRVV